MKNEVDRVIETEQYFDIYSALTSLENFKYSDVDSELYESAIQDTYLRLIFKRRRSVQATVIQKR